MRIVSDTSALVTDNASYTAVINGAPPDFTGLATSVHVLEANEWRSALHQQSAS